MAEQLVEREALIQNNLGLVHACANRFRGRGVDYDDLYQAGCVGLIKAADNFDAGRGFAFSTYAVPVILGEIKRIFRDGGSVKMGRSMKERAQKALREREAYIARTGAEPTIGELAQAMEMEAAELAGALTALQPVISLTLENEEGGGQADIPIASPEEAISDRLALDEVLSQISERDKAIISLRYYQGMTQMRTAQVLGMTQVQVSRREKIILRDLRQRLNGW